MIYSKTQMQVETLKREVKEARTLLLEEQGEAAKSRDEVGLGQPSGGQPQQQASGVSSES